MYNMNEQSQLKNYYDADKYSDQAYQLVKSEIEKRVNSLVCPVHGKSTTIKRVKKSDHYEYNFSYCCEKMKEMVEKELRTEV